MTFKYFKYFSSSGFQRFACGGDVISDTYVYIISFDYQRIVGQSPELFLLVSFGREGALTQSL